MPSLVRDLERRFLQASARGLGGARALLYTLESLPLPVMNRFIAGKTTELPTTEQQQYIVQRVQALLDEDARDLSEGVYPLQVYQWENPVVHGLRLAEVLADSTLSFVRRRFNKTTAFSKNVADLASYPEYYRRNFHHQTNGYLSEQSARLYEHQVELLFRGTADPMRRRLLKPLKEHLGTDGPVNILELGCGTGAMTRFLALLYPKAHITAIDLSPDYIAFARKRLSHFKNVHFMVGASENLPFKNKHFDAVLAVYLHHELPMKIRNQVLKESLRVCKPQGFWGLVDSIQLGDDPKLDYAIKDFPKHFHEPYFTNYIKRPLIPILEKIDPKAEFEEKSHLLSKVVFRRTL